jgi:uncharacterized protein YegP (UPF0339 family)
MWRFEIFKDEDRGWFWRLIQRDTVIVLESLTSFAQASDAEHDALIYRAEIGLADVRRMPTV